MSWHYESVVCWYFGQTYQKSSFPDHRCLDCTCEGTPQTIKNKMRITIMLGSKVKIVNSSETHHTFIEQLTFLRCVMYSPPGLYTLTNQKRGAGCSIEVFSQTSVLQKCLARLRDCHPLRSTSVHLSAAQGHYKIRRATLHSDTVFYPVV